MPFYPWSDVDPNTGRFPAGNPASGFLNDALDAFCAINRQTGQWLASVYRSAGIPSGPAAWLAGTPITDLACGTPGYPPAPTVPGVPPFPVNCATFGVVDYRTNISGSLVNPQWIPGQDVWDCNANVGRPIGNPRWVNFGGSAWGYAQTFERPDGSGTVVRSFGQTTFGDVQERVQILSVNIQYCPGCGLPPPPPVPPIIPERPDDPDPDDPPIINIDIDFPIAPGLPPITFPVTYSPTVNLNLAPSFNAPITFRPRVDLNPSFNFAPSFEVNLGGISIGGGGYPEPRPDVTEILECDCPDPCPDPGGSVDYARIATIVESRLGAVRDIPVGELGVIIGDAVSGVEIELTLPDGCRGVLYEFDLSEYTGGGSFASTVDRSVYYPGYCWFGFSGDYPGGDRRFINARAGYLEAPSFANRFTLIAKDGAVATVRTVRSADFPPP